MKTLHSGTNLLLKRDGDTLILDAQPGHSLTSAQIRQIDGLMTPADEDTWFGDLNQQHAIEALVRQLDLPWTSQAEETRAAQQRIGGR